MSKTAVLQRMRGLEGYNISDFCYRISMKTGVIAAGLAANSCLFSMRPAALNGVGNAGVALIERIRLQYTCVTAFGTPVTAGRSLAIGTGTGTPGGGTQLTEPFSKGEGSQQSIFGTNRGGLTFIATTGALTVVTPTFTDVKLAELSLVGFGASGATVDQSFDFFDEGATPVAISTGANTDIPVAQVVVFNPQVMDAAGTFELVVEVDVIELPPDFVYPSD